MRKMVGMFFSYKKEQADIPLEKTPNLTDQSLCVEKKNLQTEQASPIKEIQEILQKDYIDPNKKYQEAISLLTKNILLQIETMKNYGVLNITKSNINNSNEILKNHFDNQNEKCSKLFLQYKKNTNQIQDIERNKVKQNNFEDTKSLRNDIDVLLTSTRLNITTMKEWNSSNNETSNLIDTARNAVAVENEKIFDIGTSEEDLKKYFHTLIHVNQQCETAINLKTIHSKLENLYKNLCSFTEEKEEKPSTTQSTTSIITNVLSLFSNDPKPENTTAQQGNNNSHQEENAPKNQKEHLQTLINRVNPLLKEPLTEIELLPTTDLDLQKTKKTIQKLLRALSGQLEKSELKDQDTKQRLLLFSKDFSELNNQFNEIPNIETPKA